MRRMGGNIRVAGLAIVLFTVAFVTVLATRQSASPRYAQAVVAGTLLGDPLVASGVESFVGGQRYASEVARRANPDAVAARERSRTTYAHLPSRQVGKLLAESFPSVVKQSATGASALLRGTRIVGYPSAHAIQVRLPNGQPGIVESSSPVAKRTSHGHYAPLDLSLTSVGSSYVPARSNVAVQIPKELSSGIHTPENGVTLTPIDSGGQPLSGHGSVDRSIVVYANTLRATDTLVKPTSTGFQLDAALRAVSSPRELRFKVGAPAGATLAQDSGSGVVRVVTNGGALATILPPAAVDSAGTTVPATMSVAGNTITVGVGHRSGSYRYPIEVDPEVNDSQLATATGGKRANWEFKSSNEARFGHKAVYEGPGKEHLETTGTAEYVATEFAYWAYETKGNSKIYELKTKTSAKNKLAKIESFLEFRYSGGPETKKILSTELEEPEYAEKVSTICAWNASKIEECLPASGKEKNVVRFQQSATASPGANFKFLDTMSEGIVSISEPSGEHSTTKFNTTSPEVEGEVEGKMQKRVNALYGAGIWLTNSKGALQPISKDPGIGVATTRLEFEKSAGSWENLSEHRYLEIENACQGVQCYIEHAEYWTLDPKLPDGEDKIRYRAEEAIAGTVSLAGETESTKTVKVDTKAPHNIALSGLPFGNELSEKPYKLSASAIDGTGSTIASSGVKRLALFVSGHEVTELGTQTGCSVAKGECTGKAEWSINGAELGAGHHAIVIVATDNAGNESRLEETITVRHSTPVPLGPGSVDLESGDFTLSATDVSQGSGLTVSRDYSSRATQAGIEGGLGAQWSMSLGKSESLSELVDGSVLVTASNGKQLIFASTGEGKFEAPFGDSNLKLELEENKVTKEKLAYYLKNPTAGTSDKFTLPTGSKIWVPTKQEGTVATDTVTYTYKAVDHQDKFPTASTEPNLLGGVATGPDGNIWFTDGKNNKVGKMSPSGTVLAEYATQGEEPRVPGNIVTGSDGRLWFLQGGTTGAGKERVVKITTSGTQTSYSLGNQAAKLVAGPDGNIWFTEQAAKKVGKITPTGTVTQYVVPKGEPYAIAAGPDGNVWFATLTPNSRIDKITPSGVITEYLPASESKLVEAMTAGPDGNVWFSQTGNIDKITPAGVVTSYTLSSGGVAGAMITGPDKNVWFSQSLGPKYMGKITPSGVITEFALERSFGMAAGPDGNIWFTDNWNKTIDRTTQSGKVDVPTEVLAPVPAGVSCSPEMKAGCRALKFFSEPTGGPITSITLQAYNPTSKKVEETTIAKYSYNARSQLIAEWDPRYGSELKTTYGYDAEGHITALNAPGEETWAFTYGTLQGDVGTGRLLKVTRPPSSETVWTGGEAPKNTELPSVTGSALEGVRMTVSDGVWTGSPLAYGYQWERCEVSNELCTLIAGANSPNYTLTTADAAHKIAVLVTATNGGGTTTVSTILSSEIKARPALVFTGESSPRGVASGPDGNLWVAKSTVITKAPVAGGLRTGYGVPAGSEPYDIASGPDGNLWFTEHGTSKIGKITTAGVITEYALPAGSQPGGIAAGPDGNLWFTDYGTKKIGKITTAGVITEYNLTTANRQPLDIASGPDGNLWFVTEQGKLCKITTTGTVTAYTLPEGSNPHGIAAGADGNLWFTEYGTDKIGKSTTSGSITEYPLAAGSNPYGITAGPDGNLWFSEYSSNKIGKATTTGLIAEYVPTSGKNPLGIAAGSDGNLWFTDFTNNSMGKATVGTEGAPRTPTRGWVMEYNTPLTAGMGLQGMTSGDVAKWGQTDVPVEATAIVPPDANQGWPATSYTRATVYYLDAQGLTTNVSSPSTAPYGSITTSEYNEFNDKVRTLTAGNRQAALEAGSKSVDEAKLRATYYVYKGECSKESENKHEAESFEPGSRLCETEGPQHLIKYMAGGEQKEELGRLHTKYFYDENSPGGVVYNLLTKTSSLAELANEEEVEVHKTTVSYSGQSNLGWTLRAPTSVTVDPEGKKLTTTTIYNSATGQIAETRAPAGSSGESAHDTKRIYYTAAANTEGFPECGTHPEWSGLLCATLPAKQPAAGAPPKLPVTVVASYNMWNEPLVTTETFGSTVRTETNIYALAERLTSSEKTSTAGVALPRVDYEYNSKTGLREKQKITVEAKAKTITSKYNTLGQLTEYTDADGGITKYRYGGLENDYLLEEMADGSNGGTGKQTYTYNATTKAREELWDSAAGTFTASYNADGQLASEVYPNAMCAKYGRNSAGEATQIEYVKTANCGEVGAPVWFSETRVPSVRGETLSRSNTLASETYAYDSVGQLVEAHETPAGEGCSTRLYVYDEESNRTSQTTRVPGAEGKCATEGGTVLSHTYDEGNRLTDTGISYDSFGNVTKLPAADAEGNELSSTFYVSNAVASQSQKGVTNNYYLDGEGRVRETVSGVTAAVAHYDKPGEGVSWTSESEGKSTRNIGNIDGSLVATQTNGGTPVLQLHDLQGNVTATAALSPTETEVLSTYNSTEFGVPNSGVAPPKYAWLGATDVASAFTSGVITYGATSYVPQIGRALQSEAVDPPGSPQGSGAGAGYTSQEQPWVFQGAAAEAAEAPGLEAARELAAAEAALRAALAAGGEDPTLYFLQKRAVEVGKKLKDIKSWSEVWDGVFGVLGLVADPVGAVIGAVVGVITLAVMEDWLHNTGGKLEQCGKNREYWVDECMLKYETILGGRFVDPYSTSEVEKCGTYFWYAKKLFAKEAWECRRLNQDPGPV